MKTLLLFLQAQNVKNVTCTSIFRQDYFVARVCTSPEPVKQISTSQLNPAKELFRNWNDEYMLWHTSKFGNDNYLLQVDSCYTLKEFLSNPDYWTILPKGNLDELKKMIPLQVYELEDAPPARICYLLTNTYPDKNNLKILRLFKEWALKFKFLQIIRCFLKIPIEPATGSFYYMYNIKKRHILLIPIGDFQENMPSYYCRLTNPR